MHSERPTYRYLSLDIRQLPNSILKWRELAYLAISLSFSHCTTEKSFFLLDDNTIFNITEQPVAGVSDVFNQL